MSHNKSQISPIPPEAYGDRFLKFISGLTMTKEAAERRAESADQQDGSMHANPRQTSFPVSRHSTDIIVEKAERQAQRTEKEGATEEPNRDRILASVRSPSAERTNGVGGAALPVVEEDAEGGSREDSLRDEKASGSALGLQPSIQDQSASPLPAKKVPLNGAQLPTIPSFNRLSIGIGGR